MKKIKNYLKEKMSVSKSGAFLSLNRRGLAGLTNKCMAFYPLFKVSDALYKQKIFHILRKAQNTNFLIDFKKKVRIKNGTIFYFWWNGYENLPPICKACYNSLLKFSNGHNVIFLDKNNFKDFVDIPTFVINKFNAGNISITLFSDVLRLFLLSTYNCVWVDSTMFFVKPIPEEYFDLPFCSCNSKQIIKDINDLTAIVNYHYPVYFFISNNGFIFKDVATLLVKYWLLFSYPIDYFLTNYVFDFVIAHCNTYKDFIKSMPVCCPRVEWLLPRLEKQFNKKDFDDACQNTFIFKLNWKKTIANKENSYYHLLLESNAK